MAYSLSIPKNTVISNWVPRTYIQYPKRSPIPSTKSFARAFGCDQIPEVPSLERGTVSSFEFEGVWPALFKDARLFAAI